MSDAPPPGWGGPPPPPQQPPNQGPYSANYGQQPPPPPAGYTAYNPQGGGGANYRTYPQGTTILVLGILSFFCFGIVLGTIAAIMGTKALREIDSDPSTTYTNRGQVNAGRICGIIGAVISLVGLVVIVATR